MSTFSPSHFLTISPELHFSIISHLSLSDKRHLRLVNQKFSNFLIFEVPLEELRTAREEKTIFLVEGARKGQLGFEPFIVRDVRKIREDSDNTDATQPVQPSVRREKILLDIYYPKFMRNDDIRGGDIEPPEKDGWEIKINMTELSLYSESGDLDELPPGSTRLIESVDYDSLRGRLLKASATLFRSRFRCPECRNARDVCPGCGGFSGRFNYLSTDCGLSMPCPVCIGSDAAGDAKGIQDDEEGLDALWEEIYTMLAEERA